MENAAFFDLTPFSMVEVYGNFGGALLLRLQGTLKMEATLFFETSLSIYPNTGRLHGHRPENHGSHEQLLQGDWYC
jgi:hypothetical protein